MHAATLAFAFLLTGGDPAFPTIPHPSYSPCPPLHAPGSSREHRRRIEIERLKTEIAERKAEVAALELIAEPTCRQHGTDKASACLAPNPGCSHQVPSCTERCGAGGSNAGWTHCGPPCLHD